MNTTQAASDLMDYALMRERAERAEAEAAALREQLAAVTRERDAAVSACESAAKFFEHAMLGSVNKSPTYHQLLDVINRPSKSEQ